MPGIYIAERINILISVTHQIYNLYCTVFYNPKWTFQSCSIDVWPSPYHLLQDHLVKQGMKTEQAAALVEMTAAKCSTVKYDVELAEEYIARQVMITLSS